jgi:hypothetical protein
MAHHAGLGAPPLRARGQIMEQTQRRGMAKLMLRWPKYRVALRERAMADPYLLELIGAYESACEAFDYWSSATVAVAGDRANEYRELLLATEDDILARVK